MKYKRALGDALRLDQSNSIRKKRENILHICHYKVVSYLYTTKNFVHTYIQSHKLFFTCTPFWTEGVLAEANRDGQRRFYPSDSMACALPAYS